MACATLEVTLRTPVAIEAAKAIIAEVPEAIVGIGTILNADDLARARSARRQIRHQPRRHAGSAEGRRRQRLAVRAGYCDRVRTDAGTGPGFDLVKFFPAEQAGGIKALRALAGPFPNVRFCPTGGIGEANAASWLAEPNVVAVGGSWLCPAAEIRAGNWAGITAMCDQGHEIA